MLKENAALAHVESRFCPINGDLLPPRDPGRIVSQRACEQLIAATNSLPELMQTVFEVLSGAGRQRAGGGGTVAGPRAPLNVSLLDEVSDLRDTVDVWASALMQYALPGSMRRAEDWVNARVVFRRFAVACGHWTESWQGKRQDTGVMCVEEVLYAVRRLDSIVNPREVETRELSSEEAEESVRGLWLTVRAACDTVRSLTGADLKPDTVRKWDRRGKFQGEEAVRTDEGTGANLYPVGRLLDLARA